MCYADIVVATVCMYLTMEFRHGEENWFYSRF